MRGRSTRAPEAASYYAGPRNEFCRRPIAEGNVSFTLDRGGGGELLTVFVSNNSPPPPLSRVKETVPSAMGLQQNSHFLGQRSMMPLPGHVSTSQDAKLARLFASCLWRGMAHSRARNTVIHQYDYDIQSVAGSRTKQNGHGHSRTFRKTKPSSYTSPTVSTTNRSISSATRLATTTASDNT